MEYLGYVLQAIPYAMAMLMPLFLVSALVWFQRSFAAGSMAVVFTLVVNTAFPMPEGLRLGVTWFLPDIVLILLAASTVLRLVVVPEARLGVRAYYVLASVVVVNLALGLAEYGTAAGVSVRPTFYAMVACAYAMSFPMSTPRLHELVRALVAGGLVYFALATFRAAVVALDIRELLPASGSFQPAGHSVWRVIVSNETLLLAELGLAMWFHPRVAPVLSRLRWLAPLLLLAVMALQHRSVWVALVAGSVAAQAAKASSGAGGLRRLLPLLLLAGLAVAGIRLAGSEGGLGGDIAKSTRDAIELKGTAGERLGSWQQLVRDWARGGPRVLAIGNPFGKSNERYSSTDLGARKIAYQPHNYYVEVLWGLGTIGLAALLSLYGYTVRGLWRARNDAHVFEQAQLLLMLLACQMAFYLTYGVDYVQALFLGAALSWVRLHEANEAPGGVQARAHPAEVARGR